MNFFGFFSFESETISVNHFLCFINATLFAADIIETFAVEVNEAENVD